MKKKRIGIRTHVALLTLLPALLLVLALDVYFVNSRFNDQEQSLMERGKLLVQQLAFSSEYGVFSNNQLFLQGIADATLKQPDVRGVLILDGKGEVLVRSADFSNLRVLERLNILTPVHAKGSSLWLYQPIVPAQIVLDDLGGPALAQQIGAVVVELSRDRTEHAKSQMLMVAIAITLTLLLFSFYLVYLSGRSITLPIRHLGAVVRAMGQGKLDARAETATGIQELHTLAEGVNETAARLQHEYETLQSRIDNATQALRERKEEAERNSHDKSRFLAVASHDLRQPLHALGLYVGELQRIVKEPALQHLVGQIDHSVEALSALFNGLLDISKLDAGAVVPQLQPSDIGALMGRVASDYQVLAGIKNIRLVVRPAQGMVISDPMLLERILMNLISNAVRYTSPNGCVLVAARRRGKALRVEVRDNGIGIQKSDQDNIFREFFQLAQPSINADKGLGLGLAIVNRLAKLLQHPLGVRSEPGRGTVFYVDVPIQSGQRPRPVLRTAPEITDDGLQPALAHPSQLAGKRLLVVDDDALVLSSTAGLLENWSCVISSAVSLQQVERLLDEGGDWDMVISDYQLGHDTSGIDVVALIRRRLQREVPCILISGDTSPALLKLATVSGHHLLHKPVRPAKLRALTIFLLDEAAHPTA